MSLAESLSLNNESISNTTKLKPRNLLFLETGQRNSLECEKDEIEKERANERNGRRILFPDGTNLLIASDSVNWLKRWCMRLSRKLISPKRSIYRLSICLMTT